MHKRAVDIQVAMVKTMIVDENDMFVMELGVSSEYLTPAQVAVVLPNTSAKNVRDWCIADKMPGAIRLPSGRWQIPWSAVVGILGFDPRVDVAVDEGLDRRVG